MTLASRDNKLLVKDGKLCTTCCEPGVGKCCAYPFESSGPHLAGTKTEAIKKARESAYASSAAIPNSIWTVGVYKDGSWLQGEAVFDFNANQYTCNGYWTTTAPGTTCDNTYKNGCNGPFEYWFSGETCEGSDQCPEYPPYPYPDPLGACCYFYSASSDEGQTQEWRCRDGITEQDCLMNGQNQTFHPGKTCDEIECPPPSPDDCGYCLEYRNAPGDATVTVANNCVTRQWCQDLFDSGQYCEFYPDECMQPGGADQVIDRSLCENGCPSCEPPVGRCCVYRGNQVDQGCGDSPDAASAEAELLAGNYTNGFIGVPVLEGDELCLWSCAVYEWLPEFGVVCHDKDKDNNPITEEYCQELNTEDVYKAIFTEGEDCGEASIGGRGTCADQPPTDERSNPLP